MQQRISVLTIAANDLQTMKDFYQETLGWKPVAENNDIIFFKLNGFLLSICRRQMLADFIGISAEGQGFRGVTIGYNVRTEEEVWQTYHQLKEKVTILKPPTAPPFGGLFFYFTDLEGNILEVACNGFITLDENNDAVNHRAIDSL